MTRAWLSPVFTANAAAELDLMVVSTDWLSDTTEESVKTYPGSREVLTEEELHDRDALNLEDALRSVNGIQVLDETGTIFCPILVSAVSTRLEVNDSSFW